MPPPKVKRWDNAVEVEKIVEAYKAGHQTGQTALAFLGKSWNDIASAKQISSKFASLRKDNKLPDKQGQNCTTNL